MDTMLSFLAPPELARRLRIKAAQLEISRSAALRQAAEQWLNPPKCPACDGPTVANNGVHYCESCGMAVAVV